jgi:hypothetical protein
MLVQSACNEPQAHNNTTRATTTQHITQNSTLKHVIVQNSGEDVVSGPTV